MNQQDYRDLPMDVQLAALPIIARTIGANLGVKVIMSTDRKTGATDGMTIWLPAPSGGFGYKESQRYLDLVYGLEDHEAAHCRYTDFKVLRTISGKAKKLKVSAQVVHGLTNYLEDVWIEQLLPKEFPGTRKTLELMNERLLADIDLTVERAPLDTILSYLAYRLYCKTQRLPNTEACLPAMKQKAEAVLGPSNLAELEVMSEAVLRSNCTKDNINLAVKLIQRLQQFSLATQNQSNPPPQGQKDGQAQQQSGGSQSQEPQNKSSEADAGKPESKGQPNGEEGTPATQGQPDSKSSKGSSEANEQQPNRKKTAGGTSASDASGTDAGSSSGTGAPAGTQDQPTSTPQMRALAAQLDSTDTTIEQAAGERILEELKAKADNSTLARGERTVQTHEPDSFDREFQDKKITELTAKLTARMGLALERALIAKTDITEYTRSAGTRMDTAKLAGVRTGNFNVFRYREEGEAVTAAVTLCLDVSASMSKREGTPYSLLETAAAAMLSIGRGVSRVSQSMPDGSEGLELGLVAFNSGALQLRASASTWSNSEEAFIKTLRPRGGTSFIPAINKAVETLALSKKERKIIMIVTDGMSNSVDMEALPTVLRLIYSIGIELMFILIDNVSPDALIRIYDRNKLPKQNLLSVPDIERLPDVLVKAMTQHF